MKLSRKVDLPAFPRNPGGVVLWNWRRFRLKLRELEKDTMQREKSHHIINQINQSGELIRLAKTSQEINSGRDISGWELLHSSRLPL